MCECRNDGTSSTLGRCLWVDHFLSSSPQKIYPTWNVPSTRFSSSLPLRTVTFHSRQISLRPQELKVSHAWFPSSNISYAFFLVLGCKVEMFYLDVEAVNTHRDRPLVSQRVHALRHSTLFDTKASNVATWEREWDFTFSHKAAVSNILAIHSFNPLMFVASASWMRSLTLFCARLPASQTPCLYPSFFFLHLLISLTLNLAQWILFIECHSLMDQLYCIARLISHFFWLLLLLLFSLSRTADFLLFGIPLSRKLLRSFACALRELYAKLSFCEYWFCSI